MVEITQWAEWTVKDYPCIGDYCYFGDNFCSSIPWHYLIGTIILFYSLFWLWAKFRYGVTK